MNRKKTVPIFLTPLQILSVQGLPQSHWIRKPGAVRKSLICCSPMHPWLYNFPQRYYDSRNVKWLTLDPMGIELMNPMAQSEDGKMVPKQEAGRVTSLNWYNYCSNNPVMYVDPEGCKDMWYNEPHKGWNWNAWQYGMKGMHYTDILDGMAALIGFNFHAARIDLPKFGIQVRSWKGNYTGSIGGEYTLHKPDGGALTQDDFDRLGIESLTMKIYDKKTGNLLVDITDPGAWANGYQNQDKLIIGYGKEDITLEATIKFKDSFDKNGNPIARAEQNAKAFTNEWNEKEVKEQAGSYQYLKGGVVTGATLSEDGKSSTFKLE